MRCKVYFKAEPYQKEDDDRTYLSVENVKMDFSVRDIEMGVESDKNNRVIRKQILNFFLNFFNFLNSISSSNTINRSRNEFVYQFQCSRIIERNEACIEREIYCNVTQFHGKSFRAYPL